MELVIDTGIKTFTLNDGAAELRFNPTDANFAEALFTLYSELEKIGDEYRVKLEQTNDYREVFRMMRATDETMRQSIDGTLGEGLCEKLFGSMNVFAMAEGLPVWAHLLLAIVDQIDEQVRNEQTTVNPKLQKYLNKYHELQKKYPDKYQELN